MNEKQSKLNKYTAYISLGILTVTMLPLIYCSFFDRATGDDLGYSAAVHRIMLRHGSLREIISSMADLIIHFRKYYQGTWSSLILFQLQPGIWGEKVYMITPWIAAACIMGGSFVFSGYLLRKKLGLDRYSFLTIYSLIMILSIQFLPTVRGGLFWWTSVSHYIIPYGIALCCFTWSMKWLDTGKIRYLVLQTIGMIHLGGGGYPEVVLAAAWYFFLALAVILKIYESDETKRLRFLAIPFICEMAGFAVSATAPGNSKRGGEGFGFSVGRVISTVFTSFKDTFKSIFDNFISVRPTAFVLLILILILISAEISHRISLKELIYVILSTFLINCGVRMPEIYAGVDVSGGVPDTYHIVFYLSLAIITVYLTGFVLQSNNDVRTRLKKICPVGLVSILVIMVILSRHLIGNSADYMCIEYIADGSLDDYRAQMEERLKILEDDSIRDAVLPVMNEYQGPYMSFPLTDDPEQYDNTVTRDYYGKDSVIAIPRDEWNEKYK